MPRLPASSLAKLPPESFDAFDLIRARRLVEANRRTAQPPSVERFTGAMLITKPRPFSLEWRGSVRSRFPDRHTKAHADDLSWPKFEAAWLLVDRGGTVALLGDRGTGKTQMAYAMGMRMAANRGTRPGDTFAYFRADDLFGYCREWIGIDADSRRHNERNLYDVPLLVIDEVQDRLATEFEDVSLTRIVDKRYGNQLPTVLIANLQPKDFERHAGLSITSRLMETGAMVHCNWGSFRAVSAKEHA